MKKKLTTIFLVLTGVLFCVPVFAAIDLGEGIHFATESVAEKTYDISATKPESSITNAIGNIVNVMVGILGAVAVILILYSGFLWMTAGGNDEQIKKAKNTIKRTVIGLMIVAFAYGIAFFFLNAVTQKAKSQKAGSTGNGAELME